MLNNFCDTKTEVRLIVKKWIYKESIDQQYIVHPRSGWLLWNYLIRIGFCAVVTKIKSRFAEQGRNKKIAGIGIGRIINELQDTTKYNNKPVLFFAPNHNPESDCIVIDIGFIVDLSRNAESDKFFISKLPKQLEMLVAWSRFSGFPVSFVEVQETLNKIAKNISASAVKDLPALTKMVDHIEVPLAKTSKPTAVLFGLGNYAKTQIIPNIKNDLQLQRVHEIDPEQMKFFNGDHSLCLDTSPEPRNGLKFDVWFISGYHHTHADLAGHAIRQGATAVIEKPLATTRQQYEEFKSVLEQQPGHRFYLCFHKRYSELHEFFEQDLGQIRGFPVDMHCIVYEIPLPKLHWYNWPNSGSRLISNGCHWIDYFMYVNNYCEVTEYKKWKPRGSDVVVQLKLNNGAYFSMSLTDSGSQRLGVREYIELRVEDKTFSMTDGERYISENRRRVFRKARVNPLKAYARMYQKISQDIVQGKSGDSLKSLRSTDATLLLEEL